MSLKYILVKNTLMTKAGSHLARVRKLKTVGIKELVAQMSGKSSTLKDTDIERVLTELTFAIKAELELGNAIDTPFLKIRPSISGVFQSDSDQFDPQRHKIELNGKPGKDLVIDTGQIKTEKIRSTGSDPEITTLTDYQTQQINTTLSIGGTAELKGENLKLNPDDPEQGIFISIGKYFFRVSAYMLNKPKQIIFIIPSQLPEGSGKLEVRTKQRNSSRVYSTEEQMEITVQENRPS